MKKIKTFQLDVYGIVQGVGFRPYLFNVINRLSFLGTIQNRGDCVRLILQGSEDELSNFIGNIEQHIPPMAHIEKKRWHELENHSYTTLCVLESERGEAFEVTIPADLATCAECFNEFHDPKNARFHYPFIACTNCGPRFTVVETVPYDRQNTTLKHFPLCADCKKEYTNPSDRRFHAESMACSSCGPALWLEDSNGKRMDDLSIEGISQFLVDELINGKIIALRALGGFQLICDARNAEAVKRLREKKLRPDQSFALMARDLESLKAECETNPQEILELQSSISPILILDVKKSCSLPMKVIAPDLTTLGVMLPTTPLHQLFFGLEKRAFDFLVVTSGNARGEPIAISNDEARQSLSSIADFLLMHDREILRRADDSIATLSNGQIQYWRQGRGMAPMRFLSTVHHDLNVLAMGADLKNTITLSTGLCLLTSPHQGTLDNAVALNAFKEMTETLPAFYQKKIDLIVVDKHPDYFSSQYGRELAKKLNIPCLEVQHHHAHAMAVMAEHQLSEVAAIIFDGTGFGDDGTLWGGELLEVSKGGYKRLAHMSPFPLPGGASAILSPWRTALPFCDDLTESECAELFKKTGKSAQEIGIIRKAFKKEINSPLTSSIGRLFDAASALLDIAPVNLSYEAEAAIKLELWAKLSGKPKMPLPYQIKKEEGKLIIDPQEMMDVLKMADDSVQLRQDLAYRFHYTVACMVLDFARTSGSQKIVLSGGVFQNKLLLKLSLELLKGNGFSPLMSKAFPPGDGQISLGQAMISRNN